MLFFKTCNSYSVDCNFRACIPFIQVVINHLSDLQEACQRETRSFWRMRGKWHRSISFASFNTNQASCFVLMLGGRQVVLPRCNPFSACDWYTALYYESHVDVVLKPGSLFTHHHHPWFVLRRWTIKLIKKCSRLESNVKSRELLVIASVMDINQCPLDAKIFRIVASLFFCLTVEN